MNDDIVSKYFNNIPSSENKINKLYMNFNTNTNRKERDQIFNNFLKKDWCVAEEPNVTAEEYYKNIKKYKYTCSLGKWN